MRKLEDPLFTMMTTVPQFMAFTSFCQDETVHFDATGSLTKKINEAMKQILLYSLIGHHVPSQTSIPLAFFLLSQHTADAIEECFSKLRKFSHENNIPFPPFKRLCTDKSPAILLAVIRFFNKCDTMLEFLNYVFEIVTNLPDNKNNWNNI